MLYLPLYHGGQPGAEPPGAGGGTSGCFRELPAVRAGPSGPPRRGLVYDFWDEGWMEPPPEDCQEWRISCDYRTVNPASFGLCQGRQGDVWYRAAEYYYDAGPRAGKDRRGSMPTTCCGWPAAGTCRVVVDPSAASSGDPAAAGAASLGSGQPGGDRNPDHSAAAAGEKAGDLQGLRRGGPGVWALPLGPVGRHRPGTQRTRPCDGRDSVLCHEPEGAGAACGRVWSGRCF